MGWRVWLCDNDLRESKLVLLGRWIGIDTGGLNEPDIQALEDVRSRSDKIQGRVRLFREAGR